MIKGNSSGLKYPLYSALALSFAGFGDAFLYPFLPQYAEIMNIPVLWIGILLSINRFIRIVFNPFVIKLFQWYGVRTITIIASVVAIFSTMGYGLEWGLLSLILFRILWGMSFAILRISTLAYAFEHEEIGLSLGIGKAVQDAGPMLAVWLGPMILGETSIADTFFILSLISIPSFIYAVSLPDLRYVPTQNLNTAFRLPSLFNLLTFASSFIVEGVLIIVIGLFLLRSNVLLDNWTITSIAGGYLAYRRICSMVFAPASGSIADRIGFTKVFNFSLLMIIIGLFLLIVDWIGTGLIIIFTFNSVNSTMAPGGASDNQADKIRAVAINATWRDIGAASGTLIGGLLLQGSFLYEIFTITTFILALMLFIHHQKTVKQ
jgi:MFS transporter, DHA1 family, multidrug resistance protein